MLYNINSTQEFISLIQSGEIFMAFVGHSKIENSNNLVSGFKSLCQNISTHNFISLDESVLGPLNLPFESDSAITYYIFKNGYMIFQRDIWMSLDEAQRALQFAAALDMNAWITEESRLDLKYI